MKLKDSMQAAIIDLDDFLSLPMMMTSYQDSSRDWPLEGALHQQKTSDRRKRSLLKIRQHKVNIYFHKSNCAYLSRLYCSEPFERGWKLLKDALRHLFHLRIDYDLSPLFFLSLSFVAVNDAESETFFYCEFTEKPALSRRKQCTMKDWGIYEERGA